MSNEQKKKNLPSEKSPLHLLSLSNCESVEKFELDSKVKDSKEFKENFKNSQISGLVQVKKCDAKINDYKAFIEEAKIICPTIYSPLSDIKDKLNSTILIERFGDEKGEFYRVNDYRSYQGGISDTDRCRVGVKIKDTKSPRQPIIKVYNVNNLYIQRKRPVKELKQLGLFDTKKD